MKKKNLKSLKLNKKSISKLEQQQLSGGGSLLGTSNLQSFVCSNANSCDINTPHICPG